MSDLEVQRDAIELMRIQGILKQKLDPRVKKPIIDMQQLLVHILREYSLGEIFV